jgi:hypothetical protein
MDKFRKKRWMDWADFKIMTELCFGEEVTKNFISEAAMGTLIPPDYEVDLSGCRYGGH